MTEGPVDHVTPVRIRRATEADFQAVWEIFHAVVSEGDSYAFSPDSSEADARRIWMGDGLETYVAELAGQIVGTYILKPNQPGLGNHVANAGFMVSPAAQGRGVGRSMAEHAIDAATQAGYQAMQFNLVVSTNARAVELWQTLGFAIAGRLPKVFRHQRLGMVDAYVMHRFLA